MEIKYSKASCLRNGEDSMIRKKRVTLHSPRRRIQLARQHRKVLLRQRSYVLTEMGLVSVAE
jgi:hypothetical protein